MKEFVHVVLVVMGAASSWASEPLFEEVALSSGLDFVHFNGMSGEYYFPEMAGGGVALFDYDGDGDLDVFFSQGSMLGAGRSESDALFPRPEAEPRGHRLFRNDLGVEGARFTDVSAVAGVGFEDYGMGVAVSDVDRDGWLDVLLLNDGPNRLLRNRGDGTFEDRTEHAGVAGREWSTSAAFLDVDRDGWEDLYVVNYVSFDLDRNPECLAPSSRRDYCGPSDFPPQPDRLYRNEGEGRFEDVTDRWLQAPEPARHVGPGLGVAVLDADGNGWDDLIVANDGALNRLWLNQEGEFLLEDGLLAGIAVNREGEPEASMGIAVADFDEDGDEDVLMTHLDGETNTLYVNQGDGLFDDRSTESGLGPPSLPDTGFGVAWLDADGDGRLDLVAANGAVRLQERQAGRGDPYPLKQGNRLFLAREDGTFEDATGRAGEGFSATGVHRGLARGDIDNDGDEDVVIVSNAGAAKLLLNRSPQDDSWLGLSHGRPGPAMRFTVAVRGDAAGSGIRRARSSTAGSFASASDRRVLVRASGAGAGVAVTVPAGPVRRWRDFPGGRWLLLSREDG